MSQSRLAGAIGIDRSTVSQLLGGDVPRLPNGHVVAEMAGALGVSADWLLGLSDRRESAAQLLALDMPQAPRAAVDEEVLAWHKEADGYKIRHVPTTLPEILKTPELVQWEYHALSQGDPHGVILTSEERLAMMREGRSDYEIAIPLSAASAFMARVGYYKDLPEDLRDAQLARFEQLHEEYYPRIRIYLYDARQAYSAPMSVFGPFLGVVYLGRFYMVFRDVERVEALTNQFDWLVREAAVHSHDWLSHLRSLPRG